MNEWRNVYLILIQCYIYKLLKAKNINPLYERINMAKLTQWGKKRIFPLKAKFANLSEEEIITRNKEALKKKLDSSFPDEPPDPPKRLCPRCNATYLSIYNPEKVCNPCIRELTDAERKIYKVSIL